ncbi:acylphosphatase [Synechococcus sp. PCC 7336]|uniref:acylphosphatase n=1 Tax=Synechococcus sp. PCC 7336 TaxID=195250 RepID=UPI00034D1807|nr:acylphosphatase [Synechococcus sp. PCC 7336]
MLKDPDRARETIRARVLVSGRVQRVSYRAYTRRAAVALDLQGWVRNLADGRVEAVFEGTAPAVEGVVRWCREGSPAAIVEAVEVIYEPLEHLQGFEIRYS